MYAIKTEDLTKYYGKTRGIEKVSLQVERGDFFGFIGPNGAGKSTLIRTLLGLISKTSGQAEILSMDVSKQREEILSRVGYLPSETALYSGMKVKDALALSARLRKVDCHSEAEALCKRLELDPERQIDRLSSGNRKKVGIVCALQHQPDLYILDEPTSGLDPLMQKEFYAILKERNEQGATVFLSSHVLSEIGRYCKNAAIIRNGQILACDSVERLGHTGVKKVQLRGVREMPSLDGIKDVKRENDTLSFLYSGQIGALLEVLLDLAPADVSLTDPEFDEVFLHYYAKEEE